MTFNLELFPPLHIKTSICSSSGKLTKHVNVLVYSMIKHNHSLLWRKFPFGLISGIVTCMFDKLDSGKLCEQGKATDTDISISSSLLHYSGRIQRFVDLVGFGRIEGVRCKGSSTVGYCSEPRGF